MRRPDRHLKEFIAHSAQVLFLEFIVNRQQSDFYKQKKLNQ